MRNFINMTSVFNHKLLKKYFPKVLKITECHWFFSRQGGVTCDKVVFINDRVSTGQNIDHLLNPKSIMPRKPSRTSSTELLLTIHLHGGVS